MKKIKQSIKIICSITIYNNISFKAALYLYVLTKYEKATTLHTL